MGEIIQWVGSNWVTVITTALAVVGGASVMVHAIAPFTKNTKDDDVAGWLDKVHGWLSKLALNSSVK